LDASPALCGQIPELGIIYFVCLDMRVRRPLQTKTKHTKDEHDFSKDKDRCAKCGMMRRVWEATHAPCPRKPYTVNASRPIT
jgi:hypothetical protein